MNMRRSNPDGTELVAEITLRRAKAMATFVSLAALTLCLSNRTTCAQDEAKAVAAAAQAERFLDGLWDRGYFELADHYLENLRKSGLFDAGRLEWLDARSNFEDASVQVDLARRRGLLERAIAKMKASIGRMDDSPRAIEARSLLVRALVELAHLLKIEAADRPTPTQADTQLKLARTRFGEAREVNEALIAKLTEKEKTFKLPVLRDDPRRPDFEATQLQRLNAQLQRALVDYEEAQTWQDKNEQRTDLLERASETLRTLYETNRQQVAGQNARLWQARCLQELGKLGESAGIYGEIIDQLDPALKDIRRRAIYFRMTVYRDRGDFALAADEARRWLDAYPDQTRTEDGLGVQLELARNILSQLPKAAPNEKNAGERIARERLSQVVRVYSRHQAEARSLLNTIRKNTTETPPTRLDLTAALAAGQEALELKDWVRAEACFAEASKKARTAKDTPNYVKSRYFQAVALFRSERHYEAYVIGEHIAARYPSVPLAANAAEIGLASMTYAYNALKSTDPQSDLKRLTELAERIKTGWPGTPQADSARVTLAEVARGQGRYADAVKELEAVGPASDQFAEAQAKLGLVLWRIAQSRIAGGSTGEAEAARAVAALTKSVDERVRKGVPPEDPKLIEAQLDLSEVLTVSGNPEAAIERLDQTLPSIPDTSEAAASRGRRLKVRALIAADRLDQALADLSQAESAGHSSEELSSLYFRLGQSLQDVLTELKLADDGRYVRVRQTYGKFLKNLAASKAGESWQAMQWVAEAQIDDGQPVEALNTLKRIDSQYLSKPGFADEPENAAKWSRSQLKLAEAARKTRDFATANAALKRLTGKNPNLLPVLMEKGRLLEAQGKLTEAFAFWRNLATRLGAADPRPNEYYEAWLEVARILDKQGKSATARQTLTGIVRLSGPKLTPEWKKRLEAEIARLASPVARTPRKSGGS